MLYDEIRPGLQIQKTVYRPLEEARMMGRLLEEQAFGKVLDMGTGTGILGIICALKKCDVTFADVNPIAVECAKENAKMNGVKGRFVVSDLFSNIKGKFNVIAFNSPFLASRALGTGEINTATDGGVHGREVVDRFLKDYRKYVLKEHMVFLSESWWNHFEDDVKEFHAEIAAKKHYPLMGDCVILKFE